MTCLALRRLPAAAPRALRHASRSCAGERPPPPRPPCRPPAPCGTSVVRVVCCAPPRARRPPCPARPPTAPLTCTDLRSEAEKACASRGDLSPCCGAGQDGVARRLAAAAAARRRAYEEAAARRATERRARSPPRPYALGDARDCLRATDGRTYALPCAERRRARCGPGREPPPPELLPLARDPACRLSAAPDPCAHRPRSVLEVDRDAPQPPAPPPAPATLPPPAPPGGCGPGAPRGLAERIVAGLRGQPAAPRRRLHTACGGGGAEGAERETLRAAGRGRETVRCGAPPAAPPPPAGRLELAVPEGATRLCVLVSLGPAGAADAGGAGCAGGAGAGATSGGSPCVAGGAAGGRNSWLSIRSLQRKLSSCGPAGSGKCPSQGSPSCPPARPAPPPPPPAAPPCPCGPKPPSSPCGPKPPPKPPSSPCERGGSVKRFRPLPLLV